MKYYRSILLFGVEIFLLYMALFYIHAQERFHEVAIPLTIALIPILAFYSHRLENQFKIPFFVWAIGLGFVFRDSLTLLISSPSLMGLLATVFGILIIFGGGLELKFTSFKKLLLPILSLSVFGAIVTAFLFSFGLTKAITLFGIPLTIGSAGLLGAILCSTDPAAIIPTIRKLAFRNKYTTTLAIAESAVNDVVGTIMTAVFLGFVVSSTTVISSLADLYSHLFSLEVLFDFGKEILVGVIIGSVSYQLLRLWKMSSENMLASLPFFIGTSLIAYTLSVLWGGSGFLAAFITGLLFEMQSEHKQLEHFFGGLVDGFVKPAVFVILGALITSQFFQYAGIGILASVLFIVLVRPIAVAVSLFLFAGKNKLLSFRDLFFFDAVRETGVIPAVLLVSIAPSLKDGDIVFAIGTWVILSTLIFLPIVTAPWAKFIKAVK